MSTYYIHKEPVLDRKRCLFGNELSFRRGPSNEGLPKWPALSVDEDVVGAVSSEGGFERLTGSKRAFLNLNVAAVRGEMLALLPKNSVFQVPERDALDKEVLLRAAMLKKQAYQIAVDYTPSGRGLTPLHRIADFVRIDASSFLSERSPQWLPFSRGFRPSSLQGVSRTGRVLPGIVIWVSSFFKDLSHEILRKWIAIHIVFPGGSAPIVQ